MQKTKTLSAALVLVISMAAGCAHTGQTTTAVSPESKASRQSMVPVYIYTHHSHQEFNAQGGTDTFQAYVACSATYVRSNLLVTHAGCFRYNSRMSDDESIATAVDVSHILVGDGERDLVENVTLAWENSLAFIQTKRVGTALDLHLDSTLVWERLGKYAFRFSRPATRFEVAVPNLVDNYPTMVNQNAFGQPTVLSVISVTGQLQPGEMGGAVLNRRHQLVGILSSQIGKNRTGLISAVRIKEAMAMYDL